MKNPWKQISSKVVYKNNYFQVREDKVVRPNGADGTYQVIEFTPSIMIVAISPDNEVYLIGQFRYTTNMYSFEIPGGSSDGQEIIAAARRELKEETGLVSEEWEDLGINQVMNGNTNKIIHIVLAKNVQETKDNEQKEEGISEMKKIPFKEVLSMIKSAEITDSETISAITLAGLKLEII